MVQELSGRATLAAYAGIFLVFALSARVHNRDAGVCWIEDSKNRTCPRPGAENRTMTEAAHCIGRGVEAACMDVEQCARAAVAPAGGHKFAFVHSYDFHKPFNLAHYIKAMSLWAQLARDDHMDYVLLAPSARLRGAGIPQDLRANLTKLGVRIVEVPWIIPPRLSPCIPVESGGCCGAREFMKLHAWGMEEYHGVLFLDLDVVPAPGATLLPLLQCASTGRFLTTRGNHSSVNAAFMAFRPSRAVLGEMMDELSRAEVSHVCGWNNLGWGAVHADRVKYDARMQGFLYYFFYQRPTEKVSATGVEPRAVNFCEWNMKDLLDICYKELCSGTTHTRTYHHAKQPTPEECAAMERKHGRGGPGL
mmetsp:Transcript_20192/g.63777  ORF Transcript_20192/g.63777 Transcript_20192/m.63777 type:complete len:363 (-) Transcript_20192:255-1343(-)